MYPKHSVIKGPHCTVLQGTAVCDFSGSSYEVYGNCNAPRAVTLSALIYCLRCMVGHDVPLNQVGIYLSIYMT